jgi:hypothetical protein
LITEDVVLPKFFASFLPISRLDMADSVAPPRRSSRGTNPVPVSTSSRGQTDAEYEAAQDAIQRQEVDQPSNTNVGNQNISEIENEDNVDQTLEEWLAAARASGQAARYATSRKILLRTAMDILYSQGENMTWKCAEISALDLSELDIKTLMRQYVLQPQKVSLPGTSAPTVPSDNHGHIIFVRREYDMGMQRTWRCHATKSTTVDY